MRGAVGLATYKTLSRRTPAEDFTPVANRPKGELVWIHVGEPGTGRAKFDLAREIIRLRDDVSVLLTTDEPEKVPMTDRLYTEDIPSDHPDTTEAFAKHWAPDVALWVWGGLRPNLVLSTWKHGAPLFLVNAGQDGFDRQRDHWLPEVPRRLLAHFDVWLARSEAARLRLIQLGCPDDRVIEVPPLQPVGQTLPFVQSDLEDLRETLTGRPVWFARGVTENELPTVLRAHNSALRHAPRMLMILEPAIDADQERMIEMFGDQKLRHARWSDGDMPSESAQILFADLPDETGLWYSLASVSFLGNSLDPDGRGRDPYEAAAHGSAILYGPNVKDYLRSYARLASSGAARMISDADSLSTSVSRLTSPDQAARMAMAAWDVVTQGAEAMDKIMTLVNEALDRKAGTSD